MPNTVETRIQVNIETIIRRIRPDLRGSISSTDRLRDDLGLDSLHSMELLSEIIEDYAIEIDPEDLQDVRTVGDVTSFLSALLSTR